MKFTVEVLGDGFSIYNQDGEWKGFFNRGQLEERLILENELALDDIHNSWKDWTLDHCPKCGQKAVMACRCILNDRQCANHHYWRRFKDGTAVLVDSPHGKPVES